MSRQPIIPLDRRSVMLGMAALGLAGLSGCSGEDPVLSLAIWQDYLGETTLDDFRRESGINVTVTTIASDADLYARLQSGGRGFDLVVPSSMWVERLVREDRLAPISHARLPNLKNLEDGFSDLPYDPGNAHSVPYTWTALGIGYRKSKIPKPPAGWKQLLEASRIALPADPGLLFRIAGKALGFGANLFNPDRVRQAEALLAATMPRVKALHSDGGQDLLLKGDADLIACWNGDLVQAALEDPDIAFAVPGEGALLSCDCLCIPKGAARIGNAHRFIDFVLSAQGGAGIAGTLWYPTPNAAARAILPPDYRSNPVLFPAVRPAGTSEFIGDNPALDAQFAEAMKRIAPAPAATSSGSTAETPP
ncbi:MAG: PotD/PotF family extracellular solute-binding protein [Novosphingobium sp.]